jgi:hypothetical protein
MEIEAPSKLKLKKLDSFLKPESIDEYLKDPQLQSIFVLFCGED